MGVFKQDAVEGAIYTIVDIVHESLQGEGERGRG